VALKAGGGHERNMAGAVAIQRPLPPLVQDRLVRQLPCRSTFAETRR